MKLSKGDIRLLGDICPTGSDDYHLTLPSRGHSLSLANLECPITTCSVPRPKAGPNLRATRGHISIDYKPGQLLCSLANNHMMDYGEQGLVDTLNTCQKLGIQVTGAGLNLREAQKPISVESNGVSVGILAYCETQFGIASDYRAGVSSISPIVYRQIRDLRSEVDIVVLSIHGGAEMCPWPTPYWQDLLRSFIDEGATIVHGHHSHVPQGYEEYGAGLIFYGLGNFIVEPSRWKNRLNTLWSIVSDVNLSRQGIEAYKIRTVEVIGGESITVQESGETKAQQHQRYLEQANTVLTDRGLLIAVWQESAVRMYHLWNARWLGFQDHGILRSCRKQMRQMLKQLIHRYNNQDRPVPQDDLLLWYHLFACESHRESIATALGVLSGELEDMRTARAKVLVDEMMPWSQDDMERS